ncbi:glutamyl-tRNA reductase [Paraliobacillus quinghaiensis]|uniref:Glutamyl-tRNA reductase n=1 Tax=Paraliobacillus quinghaiensis TaxID=470815 RepID=A0A917WTQ0_9BACI|nr:glutamyl-tRNA reductase [Paraliobacillus quinghaiensis]GGM27172.1 glutamyl-tRNA reductase [Paraliobacillus quinghaiensis]
MHILMIGVNYRTAPIDIREKLTFQSDELVEAMQALNQQKSVLENVIVSTCNRTEMYAVVDQLHTGRYYLKQFLANWFGLDKENFSSHLVIYENDGAKDHLFRVTTGLDSMVIGETQILGQIKHAFLIAQRNGITGTMFNQLFKQAITLAKRAHKETGIGGNAVSISYAAVTLAKKMFSDLAPKNIVILGAGKMGALAAKNLQGSGVENITVVNRTFEKAQALANKFQGQARPVDELDEALFDADIFISSTDSKGFVLTKETVKPIVEARKGKPLFIVDIALPRDIDPAIASLEGVNLNDIDDLQGVVDQNIYSRIKASEEIELLIEKEIVDFNEWVKTLGVVPIISSLREHALAIQADTMKSIQRKIPDLSERERKVISKHTKSIINQLLKQPILEAKELAVEPNAEESLRLFTKIFGIEDLVKDKVTKQIEENNVIALKTAKKIDEKQLQPVLMR